MKWNEMNKQHANVASNGYENTLSAVIFCYELSKNIND